MNKAFRLGFGLIGVAVLMTALMPLAAQAQRMVLGEILHRMDLHNKALVSLKADVRMEKVEIELGVKDTFAGTTSYIPRTTKKPMSVRLDWTKPYEESFAIQGDSYELYRPGLKQYIVGKVSDARNNSKIPGNALAFLSMSRKQLIDNYFVDYVRDEAVSGTQTFHLELTPRMKTAYKSAELWVDANGMPIQAKIVEKNNDTTTIILSNLQKNVKVDMRVFKLDIPPGIKPLRG